MNRSLTDRSPCGASGDEGFESVAGEFGHLVIGQVGWAFADGEDDRAVGPERVGASAPVAADPPSFSVFHPVVCPHPMVRLAWSVRPPSCHSVL
jgi:hypothetical protein